MGGREFSSKLKNGAKDFLAFENGWQGLYLVFEKREQDFLTPKILITRIAYPVNLSPSLTYISEKKDL